MLATFCFIAVPNQSPRDELIRLVDRLDKLQQISFAYRRDLNYQSDGYRHKLVANMYIEFGSTWSPIGARFQANSADFSEVFNGTSYWRKTKGKDLILEKAPNAAFFAPISVLKNSLIGLSASLRAVANEAPNGLDTVSNKITFEVKGKELGVGGPLTPVEYWPRYEITIDPKSGLPAKIVHFLKNRKDTITTTFTNYNLTPKEPGSWR